jgi:hypothetical protein
VIIYSVFRLSYYHRLSSYFRLPSRCSYAIPSLAVFVYRPTRCSSILSFAFSLLLCYTFACCFCLSTDSLLYYYYYAIPSFAASFIDQLGYLVLIYWTYYYYDTMILHTGIRQRLPRRRTFNLPFYVHNPSREDETRFCGPDLSGGLWRCGPNDNVESPQSVPGERVLNRTLLVPSCAAD